MKLTATIQIRGINPSVSISAANAARLKTRWRKPMPVLIQVNGQPKPAWPINMMPRGDGGFYLYLHATVRNASKTKVGDRVKIEIKFNPAYRNGPQHLMPPAFKTALRRTPRARQSWTALPPSRQKEILRYLASLKSPEAKSRNITRALEVLSGKSTRFMARSWKDGR